MAAAVFSPVTDACGGTSKSNHIDMESKPIGHLADGTRPILTVAGQADFAEALRLRRLAMGLTQMQVDHIAGFHDGYTAHLERPFSRSGRASLKLNPMAAVWLQVLGLRLCLAPEDAGFVR